MNYPKGRKNTMQKVPDALKAASNAYKLILENEKVRVLEIVLKPGDKAAMHNHPHNHVVYIMHDARFRLDFPDGTSGEFDLKEGTALMMDAGSHETTNIGKTIGRNLVVEIK
jgi:mannose-6-phosphate isomerase-like protein (cupin superfamily)